ncbi:hypothetical protein D3C72_1745840 [compost metagenome]
MLRAGALHAVARLRARLAQNHGFAGKVLQGDRVARRQPVAARHHRDDAFAAVRHDMQARHGIGFGHDADVDVEVLQAPQH